MDLHYGRDPFNILVTLDENYLFCLNIMLASLLYHNPERFFRVYLLQTSIEEAQLEETKRVLGCQGDLVSIQVDIASLEEAPTTERYPKEIYYRIFAARYLPDSLDRVLYLDPDVIVNGSVEELYTLPMENYYFAAASHVGELLSRVNKFRLEMSEDGLYINSGVMLMNLELLRKEQKEEDVFQFVREHKNTLILPDQDVISGLYGTKIYPLDAFRYNMTERLFALHAPFEKELDLEWVRENSVIIHYCGRGKPWKSSYIGLLNVFYDEAVELLKRRKENSHSQLYEKTAESYDDESQI